ncbi:hypothetical protein MATL_G00150910 [Megalops atlanticus]|uniref:BEN domain-containing protein n=1 Tax=Megalops atlanticus TaxID=7932 RepID=A0A9D3T551_MEGAT|nr:hypothetical protein MATL_G00150910 [Megalops atlanticus]
MKPGFSLRKGKSLSERTTKPAPSEYTGHGEEVDQPFVVVKLEDEGSTTESVSDEWMRPVESAEEVEDDQNDTDETDSSEEISHHSNRVFPRDHGPGEQTLDEAGDTSDSSLAHDYQEYARVRRNRRSLRMKCVQRQARRQKIKSKLNGKSKRPVGKKCKKPFSNIPGFANLAFIESRRRETPTKKPTEKESLVSTLSTEELEKIHHPSAGSQGCWKEGVELPVTSVSAPYDRLKPDQVISPQQATEPPLFVTKESAENAQCNEKQEGVLSEVLNYCKFMWTSIQRLEQKVDSLQSNLSNMQALQMSLQHPFKESMSPPSTRSYSPWAMAPPPFTSRFTRSRLKPGRGPVSKVCTPGEASVMGKNTKASAEDQQLVLIGSPVRNVRIHTSEYLKAFKESEPRKAVALILQAVFPISVLACSGVIGDVARGIRQLDPNKVEAIREWLAEMFPRHDLSLRGADWADCLGVINNVIKGLRSMERKVQMKTGQDLTNPR